MNVALSAPQGAHYHADVIFTTLASNRGLTVLRIRPAQTHFFTPQWASLPSILY